MFCFQIQHNQHENENQDNQNLDNRQAIHDERNNNMEYAFNPNEIETIHDNTDDNEQTDNDNNDRYDKPRIDELHYLKTTTDEKYENEPIG